jgi:hypothetical protein
MSFPMVGGTSTWFLTVEKLFPLKDEAPKYGQEALDLRIRSYKSAPKLIKGEKLLQQEVTGRP